MLTVSLYLFVFTNEHLLFYSMMSEEKFNQLFFVLQRADIFL